MRRTFVLGSLISVLLLNSIPMFSNTYLQVRDYVKFANPSYWVENYGSEQWLTQNYYDAGQQTYSNNQGGSITGQAMSRAEYGSLGVYVFTAASGAPNTVYSDVVAEAGWGDTWTITGPGLSGLGTIKVGYDVGYTMSPQDESYLRGWEYTFSVPLASGYVSSWRWNTTNPGVFSLPFYFGSPTDVTAWFSAATDLNGMVSAMETAKLSSLVVLDGSGNEVNDFSLVTESGHDYFPKSSAVPESGSGIFAMAGLIVIASRKVLH